MIYHEQIDKNCLSAQSICYTNDIIPSEKADKYACLTENKEENGKTLLKRLY